MSRPRTYVVELRWVDPRPGDKWVSATKGYGFYNRQAAMEYWAHYHYAYNGRDYRVRISRANIPIRLAYAFPIGPTMREGWPWIETIHTVPQQWGKL